MSKCFEASPRTLWMLWTSLSAPTDLFDTFKALKIFKDL